MSAVIIASGFLIRSSRLAKGISGDLGLSKTGSLTHFVVYLLLRTDLTKIIVHDFLGESSPIGQRKLVLNIGQPGIAPGGRDSHSKPFELNEGH